MDKILVKHFLLYFFHYIFFSKTRQRLLLLAIVGLFISSLSLLVLQSTMGGLQRGLVKRSKDVQGFAVLEMQDRSPQAAQKVMAHLQSHQILALPEYEIELLLRSGSEYAPALVHGIDNHYPLPPYLQGHYMGQTLLGKELLWRLRGAVGTQLQLISPTQLSSFLGDVPRQVSTTVEDTLQTGVPEVDIYHMWTRLTLVQNLLRKHEVNLIRVHSPLTAELVQELTTQFPWLTIKTWEHQNSSLMWALRLETMVMVFLFIGMTLLVAIAITTGHLIFFEKIQLDLVSFWVLGVSHRLLSRCCLFFIHAVGFVTTMLGIFCGLIFLGLLDQYGPDVMPDIFIDRKLPVFVTFQGLFVSFVVPYSICVFFSYLAFRSFKREKKSFVTELRAVC